MDAFVESSLSWRYLTPEDAGQLARFREQIDALDNSVLSGYGAGLTDEEVLSAPGLSVGGWDAYESLSAVGVCLLTDTSPLRMYVMSGVHPVHRHKSIGTQLLDWQLRQSVKWRDEHHPGEPLWIGCHAEVGRHGGELLSERFGFAHERYYYDLQRDLTTPIRVPMVDGVEIKTFDSARSDEVRLLHNECFAPLGGGEVLAADWGDRIMNEDFRPDWSFLALDAERIVGYAMSSVDSSTEAHLSGWTERFGVHPDHRGRGISIALLASCLHAMRASGCKEAGVGIDTADNVGIQRLIAELGYTTRDAVALLSKTVS